MPDDPRVLPIGPVRLTMPEGCVAELSFTFTAPGERLTISSYLETADANPQEIATARLNNLERWWAKWTFSVRSLARWGTERPA